MKLTSENEKVLNKVVGLLALSGDNPNDHEGQTAMLMAQKLLATNNLTMSDVELLEDGDSKNKEVVEVDGTEWTRLTWWQKALANIISDNFRCYSLLYAGRGRRKMVFVGTREDAEVATEVFKFAVEDIKYQSSRYLRLRGSHSSRTVANAVKNDYISGYLSGLSDKFKEQVDKEGWGLILVKDNAVVEYFEDMNLSTETNRSRSTARDSDAQSRGYADGNTFDHSRRNLN